MRRVRGEEEQRALVDRYILELSCTSVDNLEQHRPTVLVEELRRGINVVVCAGIGAADYHDRVAGGGGGGGVVDAVVVDGRLEKVGVGL